MGLQLDYTTEHGVVLTESYWKITFVQIDILNQIWQIHLSGYRDINAKADKKPIDQKIFYIVGDQFEIGYAKITNTTDNVIKISYDIVKSLTEINGIPYINPFTEAIDII